MLHETINMYANHSVFAFPYS